jgi:hypothetical protein
MFMRQGWVCRFLSETLTKSLSQANIPSGAKARFDFAAVSAVRVKTLTYQSCPDARRVIETRSTQTEKKYDEEGAETTRVDCSAAA